MVKVSAVRAAAQYRLKAHAAIAAALGGETRTHRAALEGRAPQPPRSLSRVISAVYRTAGSFHMKATFFSYLFLTAVEYGLTHAAIASKTRWLYSRLFSAIRAFTRAEMGAGPPVSPDCLRNNYVQLSLAVVRRVPQSARLALSPYAVYDA